MTSRPAAHVVRRFPAPSGEHPNKYIPWITTDFRVYWTPETNYQEVVDAINAALLDLLEQFVRRHAQGGRADRGQE